MRVFMFKQLVGIESYATFYETADCAAISNANNKMYKAETFDRLMIKPRYYSARLEKLKKEVLTDLSLSARQEGALRLFVCDHWLPRLVGSTSSRFGAALGLPAYFMWDSVADVNLEKLVHKPIYHKLFKWGTKLELKSDDLESRLSELKETLVLSDKAMKFVLAWCALKLNTNQHFWEMAPPTIFVLLTMTLGGVAHKRQPRLMEKPLTRYAWYGLMATMALLLTIGVMAGHRKELDAFCDERLVQLGPDYIEGAVEYFDKVAARGLLLRSMQKYGDYYFDEKGDLIPYWFQLWTENSAQERRDYFKECLRKKE